MTIKIGINGFGRMGRLALRSAWSNSDVEFVQINDPAGDAATLAHLLTFDSVHGRWSEEATADGNDIVIGDKRITTTRNKAIADTDWSACDVVIEASGVMKTKALLQAYLDQGVKRVVVTAPVKEEGVLNIVMGVNHNLYKSFSAFARARRSGGVGKGKLTTCCRFMAFSCSTIPSRGICNNSGSINSGKSLS